MMQIKNWLWIILFAFGTCAGKSDYHFIIRGEIEGVQSGKVLLKSIGDDSEVLLSVDMEDGLFELKGVLPEPGRYLLDVANRAVFLFLDGEEMTLKSHHNHINNSKLAGSPANDLEQEYYNMMKVKYQDPFQALLAEYREILETGSQEDMDDKMTEVLEMENVRYSETKEFIKKYPNSIFSAYIADLLKQESSEKGLELYALLSPKNQKSYFGRLLKQNIEELSISAIGTQCPNFECVDEQGKPVSLNSLKGCILVIDFWASWCGPCRAEMQSLKLMREKFADERLQFVSVSFDDSKEKWLKACEEEQIPWISLHDEKGWKNSEIRKLFGVQTIPFILVVDENGCVAAKNLRRNLLRDKIKELFNE